MVKEVDRIQKKREERRKQQAEKKEEKEALMNLDPGNPQWEFLNMIREFRYVSDNLFVWRRILSLFSCLLDVDDSYHFIDIDVN